MSYAKLRGKIREVYGTQEAFAEAIGLSKAGLSMRLNNKIKWTADEIEKPRTHLALKRQKSANIFYTKSLTF